MSCWLTIPSKRPPEECEPILRKWKERGYNIILWRDAGDPAEIRWIQDLGIFAFFEPKYPGYAAAVNGLIDSVMKSDHSAEWFIAAGDDIEPDANHSAEEIANQCLLHFSPLTGAELRIDGTMGVMQPCGDRWGEDPHNPNPKLRSAYIDRVAGSAWIGREFCRRINQGRGPLWPEFTHMFVDEALREVAVRLGVYWERRDLIHLHRHWGRKQGATKADIPEHLRAVNEPQHWRESKAILDRLRANEMRPYIELA